MKKRAASLSLGHRIKRLCGRQLLVRGVIRLGRDTAPGRRSMLAPRPATHLDHVFTVLSYVLFVCNEFVADRLLRISSSGTQPGYAIDDVLDQMEAIHIIQDAHIKRRRRGSFFFIAAYVQVVVICACVGEPVDEPWIPMKCEYDRPIVREYRVEVLIAQPVGVLTLRLKRHQVNDVDDTNLEFRTVLAK